MKRLDDLSKELQKEYKKRKQRIMQRMYDAYRSQNPREVASLVDAERACLRKLNKEFGLDPEDTTREVSVDSKSKPITQGELRRRRPRRVSGIGKVAVAK